MQNRDVLLLLTEEWADWEAAYAIAEINATPQYRVVTIAEDKAPKASIGGLKAVVDCSLNEYDDLSKSAMVIVPGGMDWQRREHPEIRAFLQRAVARDLPIAAICDATVFLARSGLLDGVKHCGDEESYFTGLTGYDGRNHFVEAQVVEDGNFITANETAALEFARAIFHRLAIDEPEEIEGWYEKFKGGMFS